MLCNSQGVLHTHSYAELNTEAFILTDIAITNIQYKYEVCCTKIDPLQIDLHFL